ncbi:MAG: hypothetical protein ABFC84_04675 [Veillonellales bacterium]
MDTLYEILAVIVSYYSYTYAKWLGSHGNKRGMIGVFLLILAGLSITVYRSMQ